jgi:hypothetical protein
MNLFLAPGTEENLNRSIRKSVGRDVVAAHLSGDEIAALDRAAGNASLHCWATTQSKASVFEEMSPGDVVLFTQRATGKFNYLAHVIFKIDSESLGRALWSFVPNEPWRLIYFVEGVEEVGIDKTRLVTEFGYKSNFDVPGFIRVPSTRLTAVLDRHGGTVATLIQNLISRP